MAQARVRIKVKVNITADQASLKSVIEKESIRVFFENEFNNKVMPAIIRYLSGISSGLSIASRIKVFSKAQPAFLKDVLLEAKRLGEEIRGSSFKVKIRASKRNESFLNLSLVSPGSVLEEASVKISGDKGRDYPIEKRKHIWRIFFRGTHVPQYNSIKKYSFVRAKSSIRGIGVMRLSKKPDKIMISPFKENGRNIFSHFIYTEVVGNEKTMDRFKKIFLKEFINLKTNKKIRIG